MIDAIADEVRVDAESGQRAPEVLAGVLWKVRGRGAISESPNDKLNGESLLGSLTAVMTILKPFESVPQPSVTYFRVTKFVLV